MKDIKPFLPLYMGCEVVTKWGVKGTLVSVWNPNADYIPRPICKILRSDAYGVTFDVDPADFTLALRKLDSMTEEEIKELIKFDKLNATYANVAFRTVSAGPDGSLIGIEIDYTIVEEDLVSPANLDNVFLRNERPRLCMATFQTLRPVQLNRRRSSPRQIYSNTLTKKYTLWYKHLSSKNQRN